MYRVVTDGLALGRKQVGQSKPAKGIHKTALVVLEL
jgi:hypothetical protein